MKKSIFDPSFKYVPSHDTNVKKTFDRIRREQVNRNKQQQVTRVKVVEIDVLKRVPARGVTKF